MASPTTTEDFVSVLRKSRLVADRDLDTFLATDPAQTPTEFAARLTAQGAITEFQAGQLLRGRHKGFLLGKYRLLDRIGLGGMGQVYLAEHTAMRRRVALKVLPPDRSENQFSRERFLREARAAAAVEHPNLVRAFDIETDADVYFLVMEYIDGVSLHELVVRRGALAPERAAHYLYMAAAGLSALHARSLVHRDVKPANIMLDRGGAVKVLDLGLVRSELDDDALTRGEGAKIVGTADYLAPEQAIDCSKVDPRADIYGLGATAYFLLTGRPPFVAEKISQKLIAHQVEVPKPVHLLRPGIPMDLSAVVHKMLAKKPGDRFPSAVEVMAALEPYACVPLPPPDEDDFPARPGYTFSGSSAMSLAARSGSGTGSTLSKPVPGRSQPLMRGVTGGSVIRIGANPAGSNTQATKATAAEETAKHMPAAPVEFPAPVRTAAAIFGVAEPAVPPKNEARLAVALAVVAVVLAAVGVAVALGK